MLRRKLGIGGKILLLVGAMLTIINSALLLIYNSDKAISRSVTEAAEMLETIKKAESLEKQVADIRYWMGDTALTWDSESLAKVNESREVLAKTLKEMKTSEHDSWKGAATEIEPLIENLSNLTVEAVTAYSADEREEGNAKIAESREINAKIDKAIDRLLEDSSIDENNNFSSIIQSIIEGIDSIAFLAISLIVLATLAGLTLGLLIKRSITKPISTSMEQIRRSTKTYKRESTKIKNTSEHVSASVSSQAAAIQESVAAMTELRSMVMKTFEQATEADQASNSVNESSQKGRAQMDELVNYMNQLEMSIEAIDRAIQSLRTQSENQLGSIVKIIEEISSKTKVINDIVFKTQLLSFNASIEAARAGQHGKGFAVVAHEVGNLAKMSGAASKEIEALIANSERQVMQILETIKAQVKDSQQQVESGKEVGAVVSRNLSLANQIFAKITDDIDTISYKVQSVAEACEQQNRGLDQISTAMKDMQETTEKNSEVAEQNKIIATRILNEAKHLETNEHTMRLVVYGEAALEKEAPPSSEYAFVDEPEQRIRNLSDESYPQSGKETTRQTTSLQDSASSEDETAALFAKVIGKVKQHTQDSKETSIDETPTENATTPVVPFEQKKTASSEAEDHSSEKTNSSAKQSRSSHGPAKKKKKRYKQVS